VSRTTFAWANLSPGLLRALERHLDLPGPDAAVALGRLYGSPPSEQFVRDARSVLQDGWLAKDSEALSGVVGDLWRPGSRDGYRQPSARHEQLAWLESRNATARLCEVLLQHFVDIGSQAHVKVTKTAAGIGMDVLAEQILAVEGFTVTLRAKAGMGQGLVVYPFERAARSSWNVARWRDERFVPNYSGLDVDVLDGTGSSRPDPTRERPRYVRPGPARNGRHVHCA